MSASPIRKPASLRAAAPSRPAVILGVSAALLSPSVLADEAAVSLDTLQIEGRAIDTNPYAQPGAPYKARVSGDARHAEPLAETPQTISVLTKTQIEESGRTDLREILQAQPGITLGTGENGNAFGDRYIIRGYEARSDVFVDGLRDPGMTIRESFASEQVEISKGPSATFAGRGTIGGAVNSVSKQAGTEYDFTKLKAGFGTDDYRRIELDANHRLSDTAAFRANLLQAYEQIPDRAPADRDRTGYAFSLLLQPLEKLELLADVYHLTAKDKPDLGTYIAPNGGTPRADIPVYLQNQDFLTADVDVATLRATYRFNDGLRLSNSLRRGSSENAYVTTGARGMVRGANDSAPGIDTITLSSHNGWQQVDYLADQLNLFLDTTLAGKLHKFIFGAEYTDSQVLNGVYNGLTAPNNANANCITGTGTAKNAYCILDANGNAIGNIGGLMGRSPNKGLWDSDWRIKTVSLSVMDTVALSDQLEVFGGARLDRFDYRNTVQNTGTLAQTVYAYDDNLWNFHLGTVYKLTGEGNVYLNWSTASEINGGESDLGANCGYGGVCTVNGDPTLVTQSRPEKTTNIELGTKWNLFDEKLLATAAVFRITKDDVMEGLSANSYTTTGTLNSGRNRVQGIELGLSGNLTEALSTQFGVAVMTSEVLASVADPTGVGHTLSNFAENSAFLQLHYDVTPKFAFGGTVTYASERYAGQPDSAAAWNATTGTYAYEVPAYTVLDLFASYAFTPKASVRLNVANVTDEDYYLAAYRSGAFTYIGDARHANVTLSYEF
ncbi:catecholate siderophore receptor [Fluviicoccus keumensis]|uniref:Catecholate siderophore receptor n=1 Tax=Fluviicoccus keumensis TaxID=1435465 RepID=A0A4V2G3X0_9GAMM|nr:TonB-dependent receptor [Fluviicoccus keumensis]RZU38656.1 catecholate siderophore receptor [Fluviicoccus keumensis]